MLRLLTPVHQYLGQTHVTDDGVNDKGIAPRSRDVCRMVVLIENNGRGRPFQLSRNGTCGSTYIAEPSLLQSPGALVLQATDDHQAPIHVRELSFCPFVLVGV